MKWLAVLTAIGTQLAAQPAAAADIEALQARLREREAEVLVLRRQIEALQRRPATAPRGGPVIAPPPRSEPTGTDDEDEALASALESALVRQGGRVLSPGTAEIEPEIGYLYDEPIRGQRRDAVSAALTVRVGLPWAMQAEVRFPYSLSDRLTETGSSSGIGDIRLGLTKQLVAERDWVPAILAFGQWRTSTGDVNRSPSTGYGIDALQFGLSGAKRQDPIVLFGSLAYTTALGSATLRTGQRYEPGDIFGGRLGAFLAATPNTSLMLAVSANSFSADRYNEIANAASDRLQGVVEMGAVTTLGRGLFLNVTAGIGITPAAPNFTLAISVPYRF